jgi:hypothetical protein
MKKILLLTAALGLAGASSLMAQTVDVYLTGSTAFRSQVYSACTKLYSSAPLIWYANAASGGANSSFSSSTASWVMSGTPITGLTNIQGNTLIIHGIFTGSIQGIQTVEQQVPLLFAAPHSGGTGNGGLTDTYVTNTPTIGFSDASGASAGYPATGNYAEENVCVQPFVMVKSTSPNSVMANINNITWEELEYGIPNGRIPFSVWTGNQGADNTNNFVYLIQRTSDSGTRRCETAQEYYQFTDPVGVYVYDYTNKFFFQPNNSTNSLVGSYPFGVVGAAGNNNANQNWGPGYVGGGDIKNELNYADLANTSISYLSMNDSKGVGAANWANVVSFNGLWPTAAGAGIHGNSGTNDYTPITTGMYPCWGNEVLVHIVNPHSGGYTDQDITQTQLGNQTLPGSFLGVLNAQSYLNGGALTVGSVENEIELSKTGSPGAVAIRLSDMTSSRQNVGGIITPGPVN